LSNLFHENKIKHKENTKKLIKATRKAKQQKNKYKRKYLAQAKEYYAL
jgi:hypothetical protein